MKRQDRHCELYTFDLLLHRLSPLSYLCVSFAIQLCFEVPASY